MKKEIGRKYRVTIGTSCSGGSHVKLNGAMPGLLWGELVELMTDWGKFNRGIGGTRFDWYLPTAPKSKRVQNVGILKEKHA